MKISSYEALVCTSIRNQVQALKANRAQHQHQIRAQNQIYRLMDPSPLMARMGKGSVRVKMMMRMTELRIEIQREQRVFYHLPKIKTTPESSHVHIESMMLESIAFGTGVLVP